MPKEKKGRRLRALLGEEDEMHLGAAGSIFVGSAVCRVKAYELAGGLAV